MSTPFTLPTIIVPFLSSIVTVSFLSFIRKRTSFIDLIYKSMYKNIVFDIFNIKFRKMTTLEKDLKQLNKLKADTSHYQEKYEVQHKRIQFLKKENEELKHKQADDRQISQQIKQQNDNLKKKNRQLKSKLNDIKILINSTSNSLAPKTATIKQLLINLQTQEIDLPNAEISDEDIEGIRYFSNIKSLILGENKVTDKGLKIISQFFNQLKKLFLNNNQITVDGLANIGKLKQLKILDLRNNKLNGQCLIHISKLAFLNQLSLSNNDIGDQNFQQIEKMTELRYLDITSNKIGDKGANSLTKLPQIVNLYLSHNSLEVESVWNIIQAIKQLKVLDIRFNNLTGEDKDLLRKVKNHSLQLFL